MLTATLEALALEGYCTGSLSEYQVGRLLHFESRMQVNQFLKDRGAHYEYSQQELEQEIEANERLLAGGPATRKR